MPEARARSAHGSALVAELLVVDDAPASLRLLGRLLEGCGYEVRAVASAEEALAAARARPPDLALLDVDLPGMSGYELCRRFKSEPGLAAIPVLFVSGHGATEDRLAGFAAGAVDYVSKPFQVEELRARVAAHLEIGRLRAELERRNRELDESLARLRAIEKLRHEVLHLVAHDMRSPLMAVIGYLELVDLDGAGVGERSRSYVLRALEGARTLNRQIDALLDADRLENRRLPLRLAEHDLAALVERAISALGPLEARRVARPPAGAIGILRCDGELVARVLSNLMADALSAASSAVGVEVALGAAPSGRVRIELREAAAPGAAGAARTRPRSSGRGLAFCRLAVEAHGGELGLDGGADPVTLCWFELPR